MRFIHPQKNLNNLTPITTLCKEKMMIVTCFAIISPPQQPHCNHWHAMNWYINWNRMGKCFTIAKSTAFRLKSINHISYSVGKINAVVNNLNGMEKFFFRNVHYKIMLIHRGFYFIYFSWIRHKCMFSVGIILFPNEPTSLFTYDVASICLLMFNVIFICTNWTITNIVARSWGIYFLYFSFLLKFIIQINRVE